jgi:REP element-mobilizing transposase RayT
MWGIMFDWEKFGRKSLRLSGYDYSRPAKYFITLVAQDRERHFGDIAVGVGSYADPSVQLSGFGEIACEFWKMLPQKFPSIRLDEFVVMPNHIHGIIEIVDMHDAPTMAEKGSAQRPTPTALPNMMQWFKSVTTNAFIRHHIKNRTIFNRRLWQKKYYESIIRSDDPDALDRIRRYIIDNPKNWQRDRNNR